MVIQKIGGAVQLNTEIAANPADFAKMFCTVPRFNQGAVEACQGVLQKDLKPKFVAWVLRDIRKEGEIELTDSKYATHFHHNWLCRSLPASSRNCYSSKRDHRPITKRVR